MIVITGITIIVTILLFSYPILLDSGDTNEVFYPIIKTKAIILTDQPTSELGIPLLMIANSTEGRAAEYDSNGIPIVTIDQSHLMLSISHGISRGEDVIVGTTKNISSENVTLTILGMGGSYKSPDNVPVYMGIVSSMIIGCTHDSTYRETDYLKPSTGTQSVIVNGTMVNQNFTYYPSNEVQIARCDNPASIDAPVILAPGQSLTAYIKGKFMFGNISATIFTLSGDYYYGDKYLHFHIGTPYQPIP